MSAQPQLTTIVSIKPHIGRGVTYEQVSPLSYTCFITDFSTFPRVEKAESLLL